MLKIYRNNKEPISDDRGDWSRGWQEWALQDGGDYEVTAESPASRAVPDS